MEIVERLAELLGIGVKEVLGYYAKQAPGEWADVVLSVAVLLVAIPVFLVSTKSARKENYECPSTVLVVISGIAIFFSLMGIVIEGSEAYKAMISPEAYAVDRIGRLLQGIR